MSILDAKDLLVHSPRVISNTTKRMNDIKLLRYRRWTGFSRPRRAGARWQEGRRRPARSAERRWADIIELLQRPIASISPGLNFTFPIALTMPARPWRPSRARRSGIAGRTRVAGHARGGGAPGRQGCELAARRRGEIRSSEITRMLLKERARCYIEIKWGPGPGSILNV